MPKHCEHEQNAIQSAQSERWPGPLLLHVEECKICSDAVMIARRLRDTSVPDLPDAGRIWRKYRLRKDRATVDECLSPVLLAKNLGFSVVGSAASTLIGLLLYHGTKLSSLSAATQTMFAALAVIVPIGVTLTMVLLLLHPDSA
jgi:hypothetical protein